MRPALLAFALSMVASVVIACSHRVTSVSRTSPEHIIDRGVWCASGDYGKRPIQVVVCTESKDLCLYAVERVRAQGGLLNLVAAGDCAYLEAK